MRKVYNAKLLEKRALFCEAILSQILRQHPDESKDMEQIRLEVVKYLDLERVLSTSGMTEGEFKDAAKSFSIRYRTPIQLPTWLDTNEF